MSTSVEITPDRLKDALAKGDHDLQVLLRGPDAHPYDEKIVLQNATKLADLLPSLDDRGKTLVRKATREILTRLRKELQSIESLSITPEEDRQQYRNQAEEAYVLLNTIDPPPTKSMDPVVPSPDATVSPPLVQPPIVPPAGAKEQTPRVPEAPAAPDASAQPSWKSLDLNNPIVQALGVSAAVLALQAAWRLLMRKGDAEKQEKPGLMRCASDWLKLPALAGGAYLLWKTFFGGKEAGWGPFSSNGWRAGNGGGDGKKKDEPVQPPDGREWPPPTVQAQPPKPDDALPSLKGDLEAPGIDPMVGVRIVTPTKPPLTDQPMFELPTPAHETVTALELIVWLKKLKAMHPEMKTLSLWSTDPDFAPDKSAGAIAYTMRRACEKLGIKLEYGNVSVGLAYRTEPVTIKVLSDKTNPPRQGEKMFQDEDAHALLSYPELVARLQSVVGQGFLPHVSVSIPREYDGDGAKVLDLLNRNIFQTGAVAQGVEVYDWRGTGVNLPPATRTIQTPPPMAFRMKPLFPDKVERMPSGSVEVTVLPRDKWQADKGGQRMFLLPGRSDPLSRIDLLASLKSMQEESPLLWAVHVHLPAGLSADATEVRELLRENDAARSPSDDAFKALLDALLDRADASLSSQYINDVWKAYKGGHPEARLSALHYEVLAQ